MGSDMFFASFVIENHANQHWVLEQDVFFVLFNAIRLWVRWYGIKYGYAKGTDIVQDVAGNKLQKLTEGASILGLFVMGAQIQHRTLESRVLDSGHGDKQPADQELTVIIVD